MSETTFPGIIQDTEIQDNGVASLRTAPNRGGTWGQNGLTAGDLQKKFDALPTLIAQRLNALITSIENGDTPESEARREAITLLQEAITQEASARAAEDAKKLDIPNNTTGGTKVIVSRWNSAISLWGMHSAPEAGALAMFTDRKTLRTETATDDKDAVPLKQMQDAIAKAIADLVNDAPEALDTLKEIAEALGNNENAYAALVATIAGKVDKVTSNDLDRVYLATYNGGQGTKPVTSSATPWTIPQREDGGAVRVGNPTRDDHAVPLAKMNGALATKAEYADLSNLVSRVDELERNGGGGGGSATVKLVDSAAAYQKRIPNDVLPVAAITEIGGASEHVESIRDNYAWSQLEGNEYTNEDEGGNTYGKVTVRANGELYVENLDDYGYNYQIDLPIKVRDIFPNAVIGKTYQLRYSLECDYSNPYGDRMGFGGVEVNSPFTMTEEIYNSTLWVWAVRWEDVYYDPETGEPISSMMYPADASYTNIELVPNGKEIGKWYDTKATSVQVLGRNLCKFTPKEYTTYGVTVTISDDGTITLNGKCTSSWGDVSTNLYIPSGARYILRDFAEGEFPNNTQPRTSVTGGSGNPRHIWTCNNGNLENAIGTVSLSGDYDYVWLTIPLTNGFTYNNCKLRPMLVIGVDEPKEFIPGKRQTFNIPSSVYDLPAYGYGYDKELYNRIVFKDDGSVIYQQRVSTDHKPLSPFVETDITESIGWDGFIDAEGGGLITFKNQYSELIPSTVVYQTK